MADRLTLFPRAFHAVTRTGRVLFRGGFGKSVPLVEPAEGVVSANGIDLAYLDWRTAVGPSAHSVPLVLLHGLNTHAWAWARAASLLSPAVRVLAPSLRGHGESGVPATGYGLDQTTADLLGFLDALGLPQVHLAGHSWGGKVAFHFAASHPERVRSLVLADPVLPAGMNRVLTSLPFLRNAAFAPERATYTTRAALDAARRHMLYITSWDDADQRLWHGMFRPLPGGCWHPRLPDRQFAEILTSMSRDVRHLVPRVACPVLVLRPDFSVSFLPGEARKQLRKLRSCRWGRVSGDHTFVHSNATDTARWLSDFIDRSGTP